MPCCVAVMRYAVCGHSTLFKAGCTLPDCTSICPSGDQKIILITRYRWTCEECQTRAADDAEETRVAKWDERIRALEDEEDLSREMALYLENAIDAIRVREAYEERTQHTPRRKRKAFEISWAEEWTARYAELLWYTYYDAGNGKSDELIARRSQYLRDAKVWDLDVVMDIGKDKTALLAKRQHQFDLFRKTVTKIRMVKIEPEALGFLAPSFDFLKAG